ncbi:MAG TPA: phosphoribosylglycinamide formyltransferase [Opitutales bacterium]|nr:phosphoribosylglycinamide formyltransferase [Opitutales bacterium]
MRVVILGSGRGSNAATILQAERAGKLGDATVVAIFSDKPDAKILELGKEFGVEARYIDPGSFRTKLTGEAEQNYIEEIAACRPDLIVLAGFMRIIKEPFIEAFPNKIINLHPSLLPAFKGLDGIGQAYRSGAKYSGCTVHYVTSEVDGGPIIDQSAVRIEPNDTLEELETKVHAAEHKLLPLVIARLSVGEKSRT